MWNFVEASTGMKSRLSFGGLLLHCQKLQIEFAATSYRCKAIIIQNSGQWKWWWTETYMLLIERQSRIWLQRNKFHHPAALFCRSWCIETCSHSHNVYMKYDVMPTNDMRKYNGLYQPMIGVWFYSPPSIVLDHGDICVSFFQLKKYIIECSMKEGEVACNSGGKMGKSKRFSCKQSTASFVSLWSGIDSATILIIAFLTVVQLLDA